MKIMALSPYPMEGASARYRVYAFKSRLEQENIRMDIFPFLSDVTFRRRGIKGNKDIRVVFGIASGFLRRFYQLFVGYKKYDLVYVHRQAFPLFQPVLDRLLIKSRLPIVFDMDDAVYTEYPIKQLLKNCSAITVGNDHLANYAVLTAPGIPVAVVPTAVDTQRYNPRNAVKNAKPIVGWIGTTSTFHQYLSPVLKELVETTRTHDGEFRVIASQNVKAQAEAAGAVFILWTLHNEVSELQKFDIGVMPLHDDEYVRGKCAFKLIQYGAVGIPSVGTDIGANREVVAEGISGYLVDTSQQMQVRLGELLSSREQQKEMGKAARAIVEERFSLDSQVKVMAEVFRDAVKRKKHVRN